MQSAGRQFQKQFIVKGTIGSGTFGQVRKCLCIKNDQLYAVKSISNVNGMNIQKIEQEATIMKSVQSDYSLQLYDNLLDQKNKEYFFVMPFCKLGSLEKKMNNDWSLDEILLFLYQITQAFVDFSEKEITHLDLKPQNILLKASGQYLVCDFGCSKVIKDLAQSKNWLIMSISKGLGTPEYAAPQILDNNKANKYSDIWSLGVILYKMIYHKHPFKASFGGFGGFSQYKTTFVGHKNQLQKVVEIVKRMICKEKRASWKQVRTMIYQILGIADTVDIVTSISDYKEYVKNLSVLGTCLFHHIDRVQTIFQGFKLTSKPMIKTMMYFLLKITSEQPNPDMFFFFEFTKSTIKKDFRDQMKQINSQIKKIIEDRGLNQPSLQGMLSDIKKMVVNETKTFGDGLRKLPENIRKDLDTRPEYEFLKIRRMIEFISSQFGNNLNYFRKRELANLVKYLVYA